MSVQGVKKSLAAIILAPLIVFSLVKTAIRIRRDISIPNNDMWE